MPGVTSIRRSYLPHLERIHDHAPSRKADLEQLQGMANNYASRERFLTELTLDPPQATSDQASAPSIPRRVRSGAQCR